MEELLTALGCTSAANNLRKLCESKSHSTNAGREAGVQKLADLREAWVNFTRPAVSTKVKALLEQVSSGLVVPDTAIDLIALQDVIDKCTPEEIPAPSSPTTCPNVTIKRVHK